MSVDKLVDSTQLDADLLSVANAIRTKGGTSASLAFPAGFVQAIGDIPSGGGGGGVYTFDFTKGWTDIETGTFLWKIYRGSPTRDSSGLHINAADCAVRLDDLNLYDHVVEVKTGTFDRKNPSSDHLRLIMASDTEGFIYRNTGRWAVYGGSWTNSSITALNAAENAVIRIEYPSSGKNVTIYINDDLALSNVPLSNTASNVQSNLRIGSNSASFYDVTIEKITIYTNEAYALKVLLGA